jgi:hypothetical protein
MRNTLMVVDSETCNVTPTDAVKPGNNLTYNVGYTLLTPSTGETFHAKQYAISEIMFGERDRMTSCYYADKLPRYYDQIGVNSCAVRSFFDVMNEIEQVCREYNVTAIVAHNARFDVDALNTTAAWLTGGEIRRALPQWLEIWDSLKMSRAIFGKMPTYRKFCEDNGFLTKHRVPQARMTAEVLYRFLTKDLDFAEDHMALEDVMIEAAIIMACYRSHKALKDHRVLYQAQA